MFQSTLNRLVDSVQGALGAAVMNRSGVVVEHVRSSECLDSSLDGIPELGPIFDQLDGMRDLFDPGEYQSCIIHGANRVILMRPLNQDYIALFWVRPTTILGKAKFKLRVVTPDLAAEL